MLPNRLLLLMTDFCKHTETNRRIFMTRSCGLAGCHPGTDDVPAGPLTVALAELPLDRRVRLEQDGRAVEVVRTENGVTARSLLCTHQGCNVRWIEDRQIYLCPCHEGKFNAKGQPIYGPPRESLRWFTVTLTPTEAVIDV